MTTEAELTALRARMARILLGPACGRIDFVLPHVHVRPGGYAVIGASLSVPHAAGRVPAARRGMSVRVNAHLPRHVGAEFDERTNAIIVPRADYGADAWECASFVHEATHAVFDFYGTRIRAVEEEAAAYIAESIYLRHLRLPLETTGIEGIAGAISVHICAPQRIGGPPNNVVSQETLNPLIAAIRASPTYSFLRGLPRGYRYRSDGGSI